MRMKSFFLMIFITGVFVIYLSSYYLNINVLEFTQETMNSKFVDQLNRKEENERFEEISKKNEPEEVDITDIEENFNKESFKDSGKVEREVKNIEEYIDETLKNEAEETYKIDKPLHQDDSNLSQVSQSTTRHNVKILENENETPNTTYQAISTNKKEPKLQKNITEEEEEEEDLDENNVVDFDSYFNETYSNEETDDDVLERGDNEEKKVEKKEEEKVEEKEEEKEEEEEEEEEDVTENLNTTVIESNTKLKSKEDNIQAKVVNSKPIKEQKNEELEENKKVEEDKNDDKENENEEDENSENKKVEEDDLEENKKIEEEDEKNDKKEKDENEEEKEEDNNKPSKKKTPPSKVKVTTTTVIKGDNFKKPDLDSVLVKDNNEIRKQELIASYQKKGEQQKYDSLKLMNGSRLFEGRTWKDNEFITLITQLTPDREGVFQKIVDMWKGPICATVAITKVDGVSNWNSKDFLNKRYNIHRKNIVLIEYDVTGEDHVTYPINKLRNIAWNASTTPFVFLLDVDFVPTQDTYNNLINTEILQYYMRSPEKVPTDKLAFVVPAFNALVELKNVIKNKDDIYQLIRYRQVVVFGGVTNSHSPSNYERWVRSERPFCTQPDFRHEYEPYMVLPWYAPQYDERFLGYSKNKKAHALLLIFTGWSFVISDDTGVTHLPHVRSKAYQNAGKEQNKKNWEDLHKQLQKAPDFKKCDDIKWLSLIDGKNQNYKVKYGSARVRPKYNVNVENRAIAGKKE